jgi:hypothetical protein
MNSCSNGLLALLVGAACLGLSPAFGATDEGPPSERLLQFRGQVVVELDGNGVLAASFPTTVDGPEVRYVLYIDDALGTGIDPAPPAGLTITLNDDVVYQSDEELPVRVQVALNAAGQQPNRILLQAVGSPGAAARVSVLALRPAPVPFGGLSILPLARSDARTGTALTVHNVGPAALAFRILFFQPDGRLAGRTGPQPLPAQATATLDLGQFVGSSRIQWSRGAVHVQWASHEFTRVSTTATFHSQPFDDGAGGVSGLALDDYGPRPLSRAELRDILGEALP